MKLGLQCEVRYSPKIGRPRSVIIRNLRRLSSRGIKDKVVDLGRLYDLKARVVVHMGYFSRLGGEVLERLNVRTLILVVPDFGPLVEKSPFF